MTFQVVVKTNFVGSESSILLVTQPAFTLNACSSLIDSAVAGGTGNVSFVSKVAGIFTLPHFPAVAAFIAAAQFSAMAESGVSSTTQRLSKDFALAPFDAARLLGSAVFSKL